ncbi:MAG: type II toxin-antitoxin system Phd/YefM family antitoxin [Chlamydiales bacterium]
MMALKKWKLQDAKNHFSEVVECAINEGPQEVTKRGEHAVVILSFTLYQELSKPKEDLVSFFRNSPFYGIELDLGRRKDSPREIEF